MLVLYFNFEEKKYTMDKIVSVLFVQNQHIFENRLLNRQNI